MKRKTKVNKKKLDSLLLVLLLTAVLLIMSTYAWFTANRTVTIGSIDVHVETSSGLMISANGKKWGTSIDVSDIKLASSSDSERGGYTTARNQLPEELSPVSTALELDGESLAMFYGNVEQDTVKTSTTFGKYFLTSTKQEEKDGINGYYVAFDVFLKSGSDADNLYMSGNVMEMQKNAQEKYEKVDTERGIANAARVAIIRGNRTEQADSQGNVTSLTTRNGRVMMWEPNYDHHTELSQKNAKELYEVEIGKDGSNDYIEYAGINKEIPEANKVLLQDANKDHDAFTKVNYTWASKKGTEPSLTLPNDDGGYGISKGATKFRVYMWIEGQDYDCENNASGSYLQFDLNFSLDPNDIVIPVNGIQ